MRIYLIKRGKYYYMMWEARGKQFRKSTGEKTKARANDVLIAKRRELLDQSKFEKLGVPNFKERYELEFLAGKSRSHQNKFGGAINKLVEIESPEYITDIDSQMIARFAKRMREQQIAASTIDSYLGYLDRSLNWAVKVGLISMAPNIERPDVPDEGAAKGRPLLGEEVDRMKMQSESVVGLGAKPSFDYMLDGLELSGLRLGEAMLLSWPTQDMDNSKIIVQVGATVTLSIPGRSQKRRKREVHPLTPDFVNFLLNVPDHERVGMVFNPEKRDGVRHHRTDTVSKRFSKMGAKAGIVVKTDSDTGAVVYASAQDLRRTYGLKWAKRVLPQELKRLMRHRTIETTMKYYATEDAERLSLDLERRFGSQVVKEQPKKQSKKV